MRSFTWLVALGLALVSPVEAKNFRYASVGDVATLDPYSFDETLQLGVLGNIYEPLVARGTPEMNLEPGLATEWSQLEPNRWRLKLRRGVKFHDGSEFKADDVAFSIARSQAKGSQMGYRVAGVKVEILDDHTVDFVTPGPSPLLMNNLFYLYMMSRSWAEKNGATEPGGIGRQGAAFADVNTNGTGPFRLVKREADVQTVLEPNPHWWGVKRHNLTQAVFRPIKSDATRLAALLSGELDMIFPVPIQDAERLQRTSGFTLITGPENRSIFLGMDLVRDELLYSDVKGKNPFKDARVRLAIYQAIDINAIIRTVLRGQGEPAKAAALSPVMYGYPAHHDRHPFDPAAARKLLNDAGYPNGFGVTLDCPNDRYVKDEEICQAVTAMLARVEIRVSLNAQSKVRHFPKVTPASNFDTSFALVGFGPGNFDASSLQQLLLNCRGPGQGPWNFSGHCDPAMDAIHKTLTSESDPALRARLTRQVWDKVHAEAIYIPLHLQRLAWGARSGVKLVQRPDDVVVLNHVTVD
jgi:peptide/nickel transport system substrate-binding protein